MERPNPISALNATIAFVVTALISAILLISALVFFLGELLSSHLLAMILVGVVCGGLSWLIYISSLKPIIRELENQITTIYEVAHAARRAYKWVAEYILSLVMKSHL